MLKQDFPIFNQNVNGKPLIYLDSAATAQKPQQVLDAIQYAYTHFNANVHRGVHHLSIVATTEHEKSRKIIAQFINAKSEKEIIFTRGTTDSINTIARSFGDKFIQKGDEIIVSQMEHHSNIVPWQMTAERMGASLKVIPLLDDCTLDLEQFEALLTEHTKIVSVTHISNVLGIVNDVKKIISIAHKHGVLVMIDAAQSVAHLPIDVQQLDCDFLAFSSHKIYGPTGIGVLYGKSEWLEQLPPFEGGGEMIDHVTFQHTTYNTLPYKFEAGTPDFIGSFALRSAIQYIQNIGFDTIISHDADLSNYAVQRLQEIDNLTIYGGSTPKIGVLSFNVGHIHPYDIGMLLDQQGVALRTGHHCAEPLIQHLGVNGTLRLSFGLYNDHSDIDTMITALHKALTMLS